MRSCMRRQPLCRPAGRAAFSILEVLLVFGITGLALAIALPTLGKANDRAREAVCLSNQRRIVRAVKMYHSAWQCFPYNYASGYGPYSGENERWALACISSYLAGPPKSGVYLRHRDPGEFPRAYICPAADTDAIYQANPSDKYHACYWTSIVIRMNRGFAGASSGGLFNTYVHVGKPPGWDLDSGGRARISGKLCVGVPWRHWRSVYRPSLASVRLPAQTVFSGDTSNAAITHLSDDQGNPVELYHRTYPGEWYIRPGWGWVHGSLGFDRHDDRLQMSYLDGSARTVTHEYLDENFCHWGSLHAPKELTGDFMLRLPADESCQGTLIHTLPPRIGDTE